MGQELCAHLVFHGLRTSPLGCNFALLTGTQRNSAGDFLSDGPLLSTVLSVRPGERKGWEWSCDGGGPAPSPVAVFSLSHPSTVRGGGDALTSALWSQPRTLTTFLVTSSWLCAAGTFTLDSVIIGVYQSKLTAAGDKVAYMMYGLIRRALEYGGSRGLLSCRDPPESFGLMHYIRSWPIFIRIPSLKYVGS